MGQGHGDPQNSAPGSKTIGPALVVYYNLFLAKKLEEKYKIICINNMINFKLKLKKNVNTTDSG